MTTDTIAAVATARGDGGLGVVRISGSLAVEIAGMLTAPGLMLDRVDSHTVHHAWLKHEGSVLDEALVTVMRAPRTFTGEDVVEIGVHGGAIPARRVLRATLHAGARLADRGEFTKRAFLNGRLDLSQAEAVADLVSARTERGADAALSRLAGRLAERTTDVENRLLDLLARLEVNLDFNEDVRAVDRGEIGDTLDRGRDALEELARRAPWGRRLRDGATVVLVGRPNVGKSSLFNAFLEDDRALVSETPGTTRDFLEAWIDVGGMPVRLVDTAGWREGEESLEAEGVRRAERLEREADLRVVVFDRSAEWEVEDEKVYRRTKGSPRVVVWNKVDLDRAPNLPEPNGSGAVEASAVNGVGMERLRERIVGELVHGGGSEPTHDVLPSERHEDAIRRACESLRLARESWENGATEELIAGDVRDAATALGEITGRTVGEEVLDRIFSRFCIGK